MSKSKDTGWGCISVFGFFILLGFCSEPEPDNLSIASDDGPQAVQSLLETDLDEVPKDDAIQKLDQELYVTANTLNGRSAPTTSSKTLQKLAYGEKIKVVGQKNDWLKVDKDSVVFWVAKSFTSQTKPLPRYVPSPSRYKSSPRPKNRYYNGRCPCSGNNVCIGPRGGRYCITSGGNKRYGV